MRRLLLGLSQERLGELLGLTFQQIQKYERGANRLGASRLYEAARALEVEVGFFFEELLQPASGLAEDAAPYRGSAGDYIPEGSGSQLDGGRDTLELVRAFERIADDELRRRLLDVAKALADLDRHGRGDA